MAGRKKRQSEAKPEPSVENPEAPEKKKSVVEQLRERLKDLDPFDDPEAILEEYGATDSSPKRVRQTMAIECYIATMGSIQQTCKLCKIGLPTFYRWLQDSTFQYHLNKRKMEWESLLQTKAMSMALNGDRILIMFLLKFLNPWFDDTYRNNQLMEVMRRATTKQSIPNPSFLPPEIPDRFEPLEPDSTGLGSADRTGEPDK